MTPSEEAKRLLDTGEGALRRVATEGHTWTVFPKEAGAIVAEIDRLRAEVATWKRIAEKHLKKAEHLDGLAAGMELPDAAAIGRAVQQHATWNGKGLCDHRLYGHLPEGPPSTRDTPPVAVVGMAVVWKDHAGGVWTALVGCTPYIYPENLLRIYSPWGGPLIWQVSP
jgi:hypothetical protein